MYKINATKYIHDLKIYSSHYSQFDWNQDKNDFFFRWADGSRILETVFQSHLVSVCLVRISKKKGKVICNHKSSSSTVSWGMISRSSTSCLLESKKKFNSRTRVRFLSRSFCLKIVIVLDGNFHTFSLNAQTYSIF